MNVYGKLKSFNDFLCTLKNVYEKLKGFHDQSHEPIKYYYESINLVHCPMKCTYQSSL